MQPMRNLKTEFVLNSSQETEDLARDFSKTLKEGSIVALFGELGSGKTTFAKRAISSLTGMDSNAIDSPTFNYLNIYSGPVISCYHFDLYRLKNSADFIQLGFEEFFEKEGVCFLEWSERIIDLLPAHTIKIFLSHAKDDSRKCNIEMP